MSPTRFRRLRSYSYALSLTVLLTTSALAVDRSWTVLNGNWSSNGDWSPFGVPTAADVARIGNIGAVQNSTVDLDQNDTVAGLDVSDGMTLDTTGSSLLINGDTVVSGSNTVGPTTFRSTLRIHRGVGVDDLDTDNLDVTNGAQIRLYQGGILDVDSVLTVDTDSRIYGEGVIRLNKGGSAAMRLDGTLDVEGDQGITIDQLGSARVDLDGLAGNGRVLVETLGTTNLPWLTINGDALADAFDGEMRVRNGSEINMNLVDGWTLGVGGELRFTGHSGVNANAELNGADVELAGLVFASSQFSLARINANATLAETIDLQLADFSKMEFGGTASIEGGTYSVGQEAELSFYGPTTVESGEFTTPSIVPAEGVVDFYGQTSWRGGATFNGIARQNGNASVTSPTVIEADAFDMDGGFGWAEWQVSSPLTINADRIDTLDSSFGGTLNISGLIGTVTVNLNDPSESWHMEGTLNLAGSFGSSKINGSRVIMNGTVTANGQVGVNADTVFDATNSLSLASVSTELVMRGVTQVRSGATFSGSGSLINHANGTMQLNAASNVNVDVANNGRLEVGFDGNAATVKSLEHAASGTMEFKIAGTAGGAYSRLVSTSDVAIQGGTLELSPLAMHYQDPVVAGTVDEFMLIASNFLSGEFDTVVYDGTELDWEFTGTDTYRSHEGDGLFRILEYTNNDVNFVNYKALTGDANGDGTVDGQDFIVWNSHKFTSGNDWTTGDFNGDGFTDGQDFIMWNTNKFMSVGNFDVVAVPEPSTAVLIFGLIGLTWINRR